MNPYDAPKAPGRKLKLRYVPRSQQDWYFMLIGFNITLATSFFMWAMQNDWFAEIVVRAITGMWRGYGA